MAGDKTTDAEICKLILRLECADFLFIDEAHALTTRTQEILYTALDAQKIPTPINGGRLDRSSFASTAEFTVVLATNLLGSLNTALRERLEALEFAPYKLRELKIIAQERAANDHDLELTAQAARRLAEVATTPRQIGLLVKDLACFFHGQTELGQTEVEALLRAKGIDRHGLTEYQRRYLRVLAASDGGSCSVRRLAGQISDLKYLREEVEPRLFDLGLVEEAGERWRRLTTKGRQIVAEHLS